jgi:hypothetical protein
VAKAKMTYSTPIHEGRGLPLAWVNITGQGKLRFEKPDDGKAVNYQYQASVIFPDEATVKVEKAKFDKFWRENKPAGATKQNYDMFKPEMVPDLDKDGKEQKDEDDAIIKKATGRWLLSAKTNTTWPKDNKPNVIKVFRWSKAPLNLGEKQIGDGSEGIVHGSVGINDYKGNQGLLFFLSGIQLKKFVEYSGDDIQAEDLGEDEGMEDVDMDAVDTPKV